MILLKKLPHIFYYFIEVLILLLGFLSVYLLSFNFELQTITLAIVLISYAIVGIWHHNLHHTLRRKIVIEYILIAVMLFAVFIFINTGKI